MSIEKTAANSDDLASSGILGGNKRRDESEVQAPHTKQHATEGQHDQESFQAELKPSAHSASLMAFTHRTKSAGLGVNRLAKARIGMMVEKQFSLRSVFVATTIVAIVLAIAIRWQQLVQVLPALPFALVGGCAGSVYGRLIGPSRTDATIGASLGAIAGGLIYFLLFPVAG